MKKNDLIELRKLDIASLQKKVSELKKKLVITKLKIKKGELKNVRAAKNLRRDIAVILTIIREKQILAQLQQANQDKEIK